ncbi:hypothetical protein H696_04532 [Fonticula alba]|uniref:Brix domain-containing protein n=1 Tax=Fonticula alba TaxID=691883 RepID=A0A058Z4R0_FONAL|nr:hypothetical protein H696_04532 [Fonticula alba]KCV69116.1 hypothetical protein H696_04532 [Fonticula alba]|eukprot:XP_009496687.1 hypothetical protein H696_04532 [Fonticula alba]
MAKQNKRAAPAPVAAAPAAEAPIAQADLPEIDVAMRAAILRRKMVNKQKTLILSSRVHTLEEMRLTGNALKGTRPLLSFDKSFDEKPELSLIRELLIQVIGTPRGHPRSRPFFDRVMTFSHVDGRIWIRNYQVIRTDNQRAQSAATFRTEEIGPRAVFTPIRIFDGSFQGRTLYKNPDFVSPNLYRRRLRMSQSVRYHQRKIDEASRVGRSTRRVMPEDPVDSTWLQEAEE